MMLHWASRSRALISIRGILFMNDSSRLDSCFTLPSVGFGVVCATPRAMPWALGPGARRLVVDSTGTTGQSTVQDTDTAPGHLCSACGEPLTDARLIACLAKALQHPSVQKGFEESVQSILLLLVRDEIQKYFDQVADLVGSLYASHRTLESNMSQKLRAMSDATADYVEHLAEGLRYIGGGQAKHRNMLMELQKTVEKRTTAPVEASGEEDYCASAAIPPEAENVNMQHTSEGDAREKEFKEGKTDKTRRKNAKRRRKKKNSRDRGGND